MTIHLLMAVRRAPTTTWNGRVVRVVSIDAMFPGGRVAAPDYLYTSGNEGRYNIAGMACLYMAVEDSTAMAERQRQFRGLSVGEDQPICKYCADLELRRVLDVRDAATLAKLRLTQQDLESDWGYGLPPSISQQLGQAALQAGIEAILFHSVAAREQGRCGANIVVFRDAIQHPSRVRVVGPRETPLDEWPSSRRGPRPGTA